MTESTMTIMGSDHSLTITSEEAKEIRKNLKNERLGKQLKAEVNREMFPINLREYVDRIIKLADEKKEIQDFITSVYEEAESKGFDKKALKDAIKMLKMEKVERDYHLELTNLYLEQIG